MAYTHQIKSALKSHLTYIRDDVKNDTAGLCLATFFLWPMFICAGIAIALFYLPFKFVIAGGEKAISNKQKELDDRKFWEEKAKKGSPTEKESARVWLEAH